MRSVQKKDLYEMWQEKGGKTNYTTCNLSCVMTITKKEMKNILDRYEI